MVCIENVSTLKLQVVHTYKGHKARIHLLQPFGDHVISVDVANVLIVWDIQSEGERHFLLLLLFCGIALLNTQSFVRSILSTHVRKFFIL